MLPIGPASRSDRLEAAGRPGSRACPAQLHCARADCEGVRSSCAAFAMNRRSVHRALNGDVDCRAGRCADNHQHDSEQRGRTERPDEPRVLIHDRGRSGRLPAMYSCPTASRSAWRQPELVPGGRCVSRGRSLRRRWPRGHPVIGTRRGDRPGRWNRRGRDCGRNVQLFDGSDASRRPFGLRSLGCTNHSRLAAGREASSRLTRPECQSREKSRPSSSRITANVPAYHRVKATRSRLRVTVSCRVGSGAPGRRTVCDRSHRPLLWRTARRETWSTPDRWRNAPFGRGWCPRCAGDRARFHHFAGCRNNSSKQRELLWP